MKNIENKNYGNNWFTDMVRDNFWMFVALWWTRPEPSPTGNTEHMGDDIDYLFTDSEDYDHTLHDDLHAIENELQDLNDYFEDNHTDDCIDDYTADIDFGF
jgi:hypothetical protein